MTKVTGAYIVPAIRLWCLVAVCGLAFSPHPTAADITPTGIVNSVDVVGGGGTTPLPPTIGDLIFGPEIEISLNNGQLIVDASSLLTAGSIQPIANDADTVIVTGAGSRIELIADRPRLRVGGAVSDFQILSGGVIDATVAPCGVNCDIILGQFPGANVSLLVDGVGSELNTINSFLVAQADTNADASGANSIAIITVQNGGVINSGNTLISGGVFGANVQVGQITDVSVDVSGAGSQWNSTFFFRVAEGPFANATVNVSGGGVITTEFFSAALSPTDAGIAQIIVDGIGSLIQVNGSFMDLAVNGTTTLDVLNGGTVDVAGRLSMGGSAGASGTVTVNGLDSRIDAQLIQVAIDGATGVLNVTGGGAVFIDAGLNPAELVIGSGGGADGSVTLSGAASGTASKIDVIGSSASVTIANDLGGVGGTGSLLITADATMVVAPTNVSGDSEFVIASGGNGSLQIDTLGLLVVVQGSMSVGDGGSGIANIINGGLLEILGFTSTSGDVGIEIGANRDFDSQDSFGIMNVSGATTLVNVQANNAFIDVGSANTNGTGTGIGEGALNISGGAGLLLDGVAGFGVLLGGIGGNATGAISIVDPGTNVVVTGGVGIVLIASDVDDAVGAADGSLLVDNGASLEVTGAIPGASILGIGVGLGSGVATVSGGASVNVDGDLFVSVPNQTVFDLLSLPTTGNSAQTGSLDILGTSVVTALRTTVGANGIILGDGTLVSDSLLAQNGGVVALDGLTNVRDILIDGVGSQLTAGFVDIGGQGPGSFTVANGATAAVAGLLNVASGSLSIIDSQLDVTGTPGVVPAIININAAAGDSAAMTVSGGGLTVLDSFQENQARLFIGVAGSGSVDVVDGGQIVIQDSVDTPGSNGGIFIGLSSDAVASSGALTVDGPGSSLVLQNSQSVVLVGLSDVGAAVADGVFNVTNGATVVIDGRDSLGILAAGNGNASGSITVSGAGSRIDISGQTEGLLDLGTDFNSDVGGTGSMRISDGAEVTVSGGLFAENEVVVGEGGDATLQIDTGGSLSVDGFMLIGEGGTGKVDVLSGGSLLFTNLNAVDAETGIEIGLSRGFDDADGAGELNVSGVGSSVSVQGIDAFIVMGSASNEEDGFGNAVGALNVSDGASLLVEADGEIGAIVAGNGGNSTGTLSISGAGTSAVVSGSSGVVIVAGDIGMAVGAADGSLLVTDGATLDVFGTDPGTSVLVIGMGLGNGTAEVSGGASVSVDGGLFVSAANATILDPFNLPDEPSSGNDAQTGFLTINDTASVIANFTTIGNRGTLGGTGFLASDTFIDPGGSLEMSGSITGNVFNFGGTVDPGGAGVVGGTLSITGNYSQEAGLLRFSLAGNQPGQFDQLDVSGDIDLFGGAVEVELVGGATTAATNGVPLMLARGALTIDEAVAFNVGAGQPAFELVPSEAFFVDPSTGSQVATQIASLNFLEQNLADVVELAGLPPNQASLAASFDDTCGDIAGVSDLTPEEQDLLLVCTDVRNAGNTPEQIAQALDALGTDEVTQTTNSTLLFTIPQHGNLSQRVNSIHSGSNPVDFSGLNLRFEEHQIAGADLERFVKGLLGIGAGDADEFSRWGVFGNGNINFGDKNATDNGNGFDYETITMTIGADYRARDDLFFGGTLSYSDVNADFDEGGGMDLTSWAVSGFGTYFLKDKFYLDLLATYGENEIDVSRHIVFDTVLGGTVRKAKSNTDGDQVSFSFGTGYDFTPGAWVFGPHGGANYTDLETDSYTEEGAGGLNLTIDRQTATSFTANVGFHVSYTYTPEWGVITPYLRADYVREFEEDAEIVEVSFANDRFVNDPLNPSEPIRISTDERDKEYFVYSVGASIQLIRGIAGFLNYRTAQHLENLSLTDITWGLRFETEW